MGKKTDTLKKAAAPVAATAVAEAPAKKTAKKTAKPAVRKAPAAKSVKKSAPQKTSADDIALRAYFIAEKRRLTGQPGDSQSDWLESERQLRGNISAKKLNPSAKANGASAV